MSESTEVTLDSVYDDLRSFIDSGGRIPAHPVLGPSADGSRNRPYNLVLHDSVEPYLVKGGYSEGDLVQPLGLMGSWWRITYSRYIPDPNIGYKVD